jgi:allophanate hydrolase
MEGLSLNRQLTERGAFLLERTRTSRHYRLYALPGGPPFRPGLARTEQGGQAIEVEVWAVPLPAYGSFVASLARPLAIGAVELQDGSHVQGCLCEHHALRGARDISDLGGWRAYLATLAV